MSAEVELYKTKPFLSSSLWSHGHQMYPFTKNRPLKRTILFLKNILFFFIIEYNNFVHVIYINYIWAHDLENQSLLTLFAYFIFKHGRPTRPGRHKNNNEDKHPGGENYYFHSPTYFIIIVLVFKYSLSHFSVCFNENSVGTRSHRHDRQIDRQADRQAGRYMQADRHIIRQTDRQKGRQPSTIVPT